MLPFLAWVAVFTRLFVFIGRVFSALLKNQFITASGLRFSSIRIQIVFDINLLVDIATEEVYTLLSIRTRRYAKLLQKSKKASFTHTNCPGGVHRSHELIGVS